MAYIKISLDHTILDGETVTFKAPCACTAVDGIKVYYPTVSGSSIVTASKEFTFKDAHGNAMTGIGNLFAEGAYIQAILNVTDGAAHILNADTNKYMEDTFLKPSGLSAASISGISSDNYGSTLSSGNCWYYKIGNIVHVFVEKATLVFDGPTSYSIVISISGLPAITKITEEQVIASGYYQANGTSGNTFKVFLDVWIYKKTTGTGLIDVYIRKAFPYEDTSNRNFDAGDAVKDFSCMFSYYSAS